jgi:hypothetical protein
MDSNEIPNLIELVEAHNGLPTDLTGLSVCRDEGQDAVMSVCADAGPAGAQP